jgi:hypothetical protein
MPTVVWNLYGYHVVTMLPPRTLFNASWFIDVNLVPLVEKFFPAGWSTRQRKLVVNIDNALADISRMTQNVFGRPVKRLPHPFHSLDISSFDVYLCGKVRIALIGREAPDEIDLLEATTEIWNGISDIELQRVF